MRQGFVLAALCGISMLAQPRSTNLQKANAGAFGDDEVKSQIRSLDQELNEAAVKGNLEYFAKTMAANYVGVAPNGMILEKSFIAARYRSGSLHYDSVSDSEIDIHVNGDCAVLTALSTVRGRDGDTDLSGTYRIMRVFLMREGRWQIVAFQATAVATKAKAPAP